MLKIEIYKENYPAYFKRQTITIQSLNITFQNLHFNLPTSIIV